MALSAAWQLSGSLHRLLTHTVLLLLVLLWGRERLRDRVFFSLLRSFRGLGTGNMDFIFRLNKLNKVTEGSRNRGGI